MSLYQSPLYSIPSTRTMTASFGGLNRRPVIADGEFFDMQNLTSDDAPLLSVRPKRGIPFQHEKQKKPAAIAVRGAGGLGVDQAVWLDGTVLHYGLSWALDLAPYGMTDDDTERRLVAMGVYIIVFPDMIYVNAVETAERAVAPTDVGRIEDGFYGDGDKIYDVKATITMCDIDGVAPQYAQNIEPIFIYNEETKVYKDVNNETHKTVNGFLWQKIGEADGLYRYSEEEGSWYKIKAYVKLSLDQNYNMLGWIKALNLREELREGDALRFAGVYDETNGGIEDGAHMVMKVFGRNDNVSGTGFEVVVEGTTKVTTLEIQQSVTGKTITVERPVPVMDHMIEAGNRLWGCRYGDDGSGHFVNEIYCSASGDFYRWILGDVTNDDSPVTFSVGADGGFTGAVTFQGYPTFFKEHTMFRISGYGASGFAVNDTPCVGVARGAHKSLAVVGNALYYKSPTAVMGFDGSAPVSVSERLGKLTGYTRAVGGACGDKYYLSLYGYKGQGAVLYAMDTTQGVWHKEDATEVESMAAVSGNMYFVRVLRKKVGEEETVTHEIRTVTPRSANDPTETEPVRWYAETGLIGLDDPDAKYISKLAIRMSLEAGTLIRIMVQYNSSGYWKQIGATEAASVKTVTIPVVPARCDHMRLRLEGVGGCKVYSITKTLQAGAEV